MIRKLIAAIAILLFSAPTLAQNAACMKMIENHLGENQTMRFVVLTMNQNATASHMDFVVKKHYVGRNPTGAYRLIGISPQIFSDRKSPPPDMTPWDSNQSDKVEIETLVSNGDFIMRFKHRTWNSFEVAIRPTCDKTMMYGWGINSESYFVIKPMSGNFVPPPPSP